MDKVENTLVDLMGCLARCEGIEPDTQQDIRILMARLEGQEPRPQPDNKEGEGVGWEPGVDLPPVGTVCEVEDDRGGYQECEIIAHFEQPGGMVAAFVTGNSGHVRQLDYFGEICFRPIQSHRDKVIEAALQIIVDADELAEKGLRASLEYLYDAGALKLPGDEQ